MRNSHGISKYKSPTAFGQDAVFTLTYDCGLNLNIANGSFGKKMSTSCSHAVIMHELCVSCGAYIRSDDAPPEISGLVSTSVDMCDACNSTNIKMTGHGEHYTCIDCGTVVNIRVMQEKGGCDVFDDSSGIRKDMRITAPVASHGKMFTYITRPVGASSRSNYMIYTQHLRTVMSYDVRSDRDITRYFERVGDALNTPKRVLVLAKSIWDFIDKQSECARRAGVRQGLYGYCLQAAYAACGLRQSDEQIFDCLDKLAMTTSSCNTQDAKKVFRKIIQTHPEYSTMLDDRPSELTDILYMRIGPLRQIEGLCEHASKTLQSIEWDEISQIAPKSIVAGTVMYIIRYVLRRTSPTQKEVSRIMDVCAPSQNLVISYIARQMASKHAS